MHKEGIFDYSIIPNITPISTYLSQSGASLAVLHNTQHTYQTLILNYMQDIAKRNTYCLPKFRLCLMHYFPLPINDAGK